MSFKPSEAVAGGGAPDGRYTITGAKVGEYTGKNGKTWPCALILELTTPEGTVFDGCVYSAGKTVLANDEGTGFTGALNNTCNAYDLMVSIVNAGFPEENLDNDCSVLVGLDADWRNQAQRKRTGLGEDNSKPTQILLVTEIHALPGEDAPKATKKLAGKAAAAAPAAKAKAPAGVNAKAASIVSDILTTAGGSLGLQQLKVKVFAAVRQDPAKDQIIGLLGKPEFLGGSDAWTYDADDKTLTVSE